MRDDVSWILRLIRGNNLETKKKSHSSHLIVMNNLYNIISYISRTVPSWQYISRQPTKNYKITSLFFYCSIFFKFGHFISSSSAIERI
jgi:hypothetical protein